MRAWIVIVATAGAAAATGPNATNQDTPTATAVIHFDPPAVLPDRAVDGTCRTPSTAAWFRSDAWACVTGSSTYDPCFRTGSSGNQVWCVADPRQPASGTLLRATVLTVTHAVPPAHAAWFFELTDGSTCRPLATPGRVIEGARELYACKYGSAGESDGVLGELDAGSAVWTVHRVLLNKKSEPQTIKSLAIASVRTVWQ
jgi:hypothetical protein